MTKIRSQHRPGVPSTVAVHPGVCCSRKTAYPAASPSQVASMDAGAKSSSEQVARVSSAGVGHGTRSGGENDPPAV